jgi:hypothetical protein
MTLSGQKGRKTRMRISLINKLYYPNKVKDHVLKSLMNSINGMVEKGFADKTRLLTLPASRNVDNVFKTLAKVASS